MNAPMNPRKLRVTTASLSGCFGCHMSFLDIDERLLELADVVAGKADLDETTEFPSGVHSTAAWSRAEWIVGTLDRWKRLVEPIAESSVSSLGSALPADA